MIVNSIAKWNGTQWSPLGSGMELDCTDPDPYYCDAPLVSALTVFDDGSGPAQYAGGNFTRAGNVIVNSIAKWNGTQWSALSSPTRPFAGPRKNFGQSLDGGMP